MRTDSQKYIYAQAKSGCARLRQVIEVLTTVGGNGTGEPERFVAEYWSLKGELLAVFDEASIMAEPDSPEWYAFCDRFR